MNCACGKRPGNCTIRLRFRWLGNVVDSGGFAVEDAGFGGEGGVPAVIGPNMLLLIYIADC